jgi:hypothetical protein
MKSNGLLFIIQKIAILRGNKLDPNLTVEKLTELE